jgi:putative transposase
MRVPYLREQIRDSILLHICENAKQKGIYIDQISGSLEHLHALVSLGSQQTISDVMQKIKGESSFWVNKNKLTRFKFEWQDDYYAVSIGMSQLDTLRNYILNQVSHHTKVSMEEELAKLIEEYKLERFVD